jgi:CDP-paratose 2-epimerase
MGSDQAVTRVNIERASKRAMRTPTKNTLDAAGINDKFRFSMKVLIAGICGFVGSVLARRIRETTPDAEVFGIDNLMRSGSESNRRLSQLDTRVFHGDIRNASDVDGLPPADWTIDAAANCSVLAGLDRRSTTRQLIEHNLFGTVNLLEYCRRHSAGFILLSTSRVYSIRALSALPLQVESTRFVPRFVETALPGISPSGIAEDFSTDAPISLYGATKLASEVLALEYGDAFDFPVWINRCGVLAGAGQFGTAEQGIFSYWLHAWRSRWPLRYIGFGGKGYQVRDAFHPEDLADLVLRQLQYRGRDRQRLCNVGGGIENAMSLLELSNWCREHFGAGEVEADGKERPFDIPWVVLDSHRAASIWNWTPVRRLPSILDEIARHAEKHPDWLRLTGE